MSVRIGKPAPDFRAQAYHNGDFTQINPAA